MAKGVQSLPKGSGFIDWPLRYSLQYIIVQIMVEVVVVGFWFLEEQSSVDWE